MFSAMPIALSARDAGFTALAALLIGAGAGVFPGESTAAALSSDSRAFSAEEQDQLHAGKLVVRRSELVRGENRLLGGLSWQLVRAKPRRVWQAISDVRSYPRFLPALDEARFIENSGAEQRLFLRHKLGFVSASYFVLTTSDAASGRMRFHLDRSRPSSIREAFGEISVSEYRHGQSVVSLAILADVGEGLLAGAVRSNIHEWMMRVPEQLKRFVESTPEAPAIVANTASAPALH